MGLAGAEPPGEAWRAGKWSRSEWGGRGLRRKREKGKSNLKCGVSNKVWEGLRHLAGDSECGQVEV